MTRVVPPARTLAATWRTLAATRRAWSRLAATVAVFLVVSLTGCGKTSAPAEDPRFATATVAHAGDVEVRAFLQPDPPESGKATLWLHLARAGAPIAGEKLDVESVMPEMGAMPEMRETAVVAEVGGGTYRADFDVSMGGSWTLQVHLRSPVAGEPRFTFTTGAKSLIGEETSAMPSMPGMPSAGTPSAGTPSTGTPSTGTPSTGTTSGEPFPIEPVRRQKWGIRTEPVARKHLYRTVHALGAVAWDETKQVDVVAHAGGYVRDLYAAETGQPVQKGQRLLNLYSPDLLAAQQDWLVALASRDVSGEGLVKAGAARLRLLGMTQAQIDDLAARGEPLDSVPVVAPSTGAVVEKDVVEGAAVEAGALMFRIAPLDPVWVQVALWPEDVPIVAEGTSARITVPDRPDLAAVGKVEHLHPQVEAEHRTRQVRISLDNPDHAWLPGMQVDVAVDLDLGEAPFVPESAVVWTGQRRVVFVDLGDGRLQPRDVQLGARAEDGWAVASGLSEGDVVVTSGTFLVASESRIRSATGYWEAGDGR